MDSAQEIAQLKEQVRELTDALRAAEQKIAELTRLVNQNSRNSSWPASRDKHRRTKRKKRSLRRKSEKKPGGQEGHPGQTLTLHEAPTHIVTHSPTACTACQQPLEATAVALTATRRQVVDLPPLTVTVTEHRTAVVSCPDCGTLNEGTFPAGVTQTAQYGPRLRQLAVYLKTQQLIPYGRSQQFLADVFEVALSPGTLQNIIRQAARQLAPVAGDIRAALIGSPVVHFDESGFHIGGRRQWFHSAGTPTLTSYFPHPQRGKGATAAMGILPHFRGTAVHDHWAPYWSYQDADHALCNVHHLRDLNDILDNDRHQQQHWARNFKRFLLATKQVVDHARQGGASTLPPAKVAQVERLYTRLVAVALRANPPPADGWPQGKRGRPKKNRPRNLAERFQKHRRAVLAFVYDFRVPFDNNLAERDIRMVKVQQKISGCFRSWQGAHDFCTIRSYLATMRKQGVSVWAALGSVFADVILMPDLTPV